MFDCNNDYAVQEDGCIGIGRSIINNVNTTTWRREKCGTYNQVEHVSNNRAMAWEFHGFL